MGWGVKKSGDPREGIPRFCVGKPTSKMLNRLFCAFGQAPNDQTEADLIDGVTDVIDDVHLRGQFDRVAEHVARQGHIADWVDGPSDEDEATKKIEGFADVGIAASVGQLFGFSEEDFIDDPRPTDGGDNAPAEIGETANGLSKFSRDFADIPCDEHEYRVPDETPEHVDAGSSCLEKEVEFNAHERHGEEPIDVTEFGGRSGSGVCAVEVFAPVLPHIEVVGGCDGGDQGTDQQRRLPFIRDSLSLEVKEDRGGEHGHGPDKEGEPDKVTCSHCCGC